MGFRDVMLYEYAFHYFRNALMIGIVLIAAIQHFGQTDQETEIQQATRLLREAGDLVKKEDATSLSRAESLLVLSSGIFSKLGVRRGEAETHFYLGRVYKLSNRTDKAIEAFLRARDLLRAEGVVTSQISVLNNLATIYENAGEFSVAKNYYLEILKLLEVTPNPEAEMFAIVDLAEVDSRLSDDESAVQRFLHGLQLAEKRADLTAQSYILQKLGGIYSRTGQLEKAKNSFESVLRIARESANRSSEGYAQMELCSVQAKATKTSADSCFRKVLTLSRDLREIALELSVLDRLAGSHQLVGEYQQSIPILEELVKRSIAQKNTQFEQMAHYNLGVSLANGFKFEAAIKSYEKARQMAQQTGNRLLLMMTFNNLGHCYAALEKTASAHQAFETSLVMSKEMKNRRAEQWSLENLGMLYSGIDDYERALPMLEQSLVIAKELLDKKKETFLLIRVAIALYGTKQYDKILPLYKRALSLSTELRDRASEAEAHERLGLFYVTVGQLPLALEHYERSAAIGATIKNSPLHGDAVAGAADVLLRLGRLAEAEQNFNLALDIAKKNKSPYLEATALVGLGVISRMKSNYDESRERLERAVKIATESGEVYRLAQAQNELANAFLGLKKPEKAVELAETSLKAGFRFSDEERIALSLATLTKANTYLSRPEVAALQGKQLINLVQDARRKLRVYDQELQKSFLKDKEAYYRDLSDLLISQGRLLEAQQVLDMLKEEEFKDLVRRSGDGVSALPYSDIEASVVEKVERLAILEKQKAELEKKGDSNLTAEERKKLTSLYAEFEAVNKAFRLSIETLAKKQESVKPRLAEIQSERNLQRELSRMQNETGTTVVAIYTILGPSPAVNDTSGTTSGSSGFGWVILVTPSARKAYPVNVVGLEKIVFDLRRALRSTRTDPRALSEDLFSRIFRQTSDKQKSSLEDDLKTLFAGTSEITIMWSLDGILRYVPVAALYDGERYLVEKYRNVLFTKESFPTLGDPSGPRTTAVGFGVSEAREGFPALPGVESELRDIVRDNDKSKGVFDGLIKLNGDFTEEAAIRTWREGRFPIVHLASHYSYNVAQPNKSFLLVGDGQLTFEELQDKDNLFGKVDILTLSACDTAMGSANGKEAEGLAYLAQNLGAKSVIASLWQISDAGTPEFMKRFYRALRDNPTMLKGEAVRQAQLSMIRGGEGNPPEAAQTLAPATARSSVYAKDPKAPFAHPYYWSPFVLIGNWR